MGRIGRTWLGEKRKDKKKGGGGTRCKEGLLKEELAGGSRQTLGMSRKTERRGGRLRSGHKFRGGGSRSQEVLESQAQAESTEGKKSSDVTGKGTGGGLKPIKIHGVARGEKVLEEGIGRRCRTVLFISA